MCRWLSQAMDHAKSRELQLTQELIGFALGVRREAVTLAAHRLQASGAIVHSRGHITVKGRVLLEAASCDCYQSAGRPTPISARAMTR